MKTHIIEIDAHAALLKIGVDLRNNPIAGQSVDALRTLLNQSITHQLLTAALNAAMMPKRSRKTSEMETDQKGGLADEN